MRLDSLTTSVGVEVDLNIPGLDTEAIDRSIDEDVELFIRAGGRLTLADWTGLTRESRLRMASIGDAVRREHAAVLAMMISAPDVAMAVGSSPGDPKAGILDAAISSVLDEVEIGMVAI